MADDALADEPNEVADAILDGANQIADALFTIAAALENLGRRQTVG